MPRLLSFIRLLVIVSAPSVNQASDNFTVINENTNPSAKNFCEINGAQQTLIIFDETAPTWSHGLDVDKKRKPNTDEENLQISNNDSLQLVEDPSTQIKNEVFQMDGTISEMNEIEMWAQSGQQLKSVTGLLRFWLLRFLEISNEAGLSPECSASLENLVADFMKTKTYAVKVMDSWWKIGSGIFESTTQIPGNYEECLSIDVQNQQNGEMRYFQGQYCMIYYLPTIPKPKRHLTAHDRIYNFNGTPSEGKLLDKFMQDIGFQHGRPNRLGICVPSSCSHDDIQSLVDAVISRTKEGIQMKVKHCEIMEPPKWASYQIVILVVFGIQIILVGIGTPVDSLANDILQKKGNKIQRLKRFILCFSAKNNCRELFSTTTLKDDISALHGIRVISMVWMIYGHTHFMIEYAFTDNRRGFTREIRSSFVQLITSGFLLVDTFFFMTGFLLMLSFCRKFQDSKISFSVLQILFNRIYRLLLPLIFMVMFTFVWMNLAHGPMWHEGVGNHVEICKRTWWATVFFLSDFLKYKDMCHEFSWYVGADVKLFAFIFIPAFLVALKWPRDTMPVLASIVAIGTIISAIVLNQTGLPPMPLYIYVSREMFLDIANAVHFALWFHIVPYALGMITGYAFHKKSKASIAPVLRLIVLALCGLLFFLSYLWIPYLWSNNRLNSLWWFTFFGATHKLLFTLSIMGIVYLCATDNGGLVNKILSCHAFLPLSRLCYGVYLIHLLVIRTRIGLAMDFGFYNKYNMFCEFLINVVFAFILGIPFYLICEAPFASLHKKYLTKIFERPRIRI